MSYRFAATTSGTLSQLTGGLALPASLELASEERHHTWTLVDPEQPAGRQNAWAFLPAAANTPLAFIPRFESVDDWLPGMTLLFQRTSRLSGAASAEVSALWTSLAAPLKTALTGDIGLDLDLGIQTHGEWQATNDCWWSVQRPDAARTLRLRLCSANNAARTITVKATANAGLDQATRNTLAALLGQHRTQILQHLRDGAGRVVRKLPAPIDQVQDFLNGWLALPPEIQSQQWSNPVSPLLAGLKQAVESTIDAGLTQSDQLTARLEYAATRAAERKLEASLTALFDKRQFNGTILDVSFDFAVNPALIDLIHQVLDGELTNLLVHPIAGVTIHSSALTEDTTRRHTFSWRLPFFNGFISGRERLQTAMDSLDDASGRIVKGYVKAEAERRTRNAASLIQLESTFATHIGGTVAVHDATACTAVFEYECRNTRAAAWEPLCKLYNTGPVPPGATACKISVALPPEAIASWFEPQDPCDTSRRMQRVWRALLIAATNFDLLNTQAAAPLLVWAAMPITTAVRRTGKGLELNRSDSTYWDWADAQLRDAMVWNPRTRAGLDELLGQIGSTATADETRRVLQQPVGAAVFQSLLYIESQFVDRVTALRRRIGDASRTPAETMRNISMLLSGMSDIFANKLTSIYGPDSARALGPLLLTAGTNYRPTAQVTWTT